MPTECKVGLPQLATGELKLLGFGFSWVILLAEERRNLLRR